MESARVTTFSQSGIVIKITAVQETLIYGRQLLLDHLFFFFVNETGIKDNITGEYVIPLPSWSRIVYYKGTKIEYKHEANKHADTIVLDGPTNVPFRVLVGIIWK